MPLAGSLLPSRQHTRWGYQSLFWGYRWGQPGPTARATEGLRRGWNIPTEIRADSWGKPAVSAGWGDSEGATDVSEEQEEDDLPTQPRPAAALPCTRTNSELPACASAGGR